MNGERLSRFKSVRELSIDGVDVPVDGVVDNGVIVATLPLCTNFLFCYGWFFQELLGARLLMSAGDEV